MQRNLNQSIEEECVITGTIHYCDEDGNRTGGHAAVSINKSIVEIENGDPFKIQCPSGGIKTMQHHTCLSVNGHLLFEVQIINDRSLSHTQATVVILNEGCKCD